MMDVFQTVHDTVSAEDAARLCGIEVQRHKCRCPWHNDRHPSLYFSNGLFRCPVCGAGGDSISFVSRYYGCTRPEAVRLLNDGLCLGLDLSRPPDPDEMQRREQLKQTRDAFEQWKAGLIRQICDCLRLYHRIVNGCCAKTAWSDFTEGELLAMQAGAQLEDVCEVLESGALAEQMQVFDEREGVELLCRQILQNLNNTQTG